MRQLRSLPCEAGVQLLPSRWAHVFLAWARSDARHFTTLGAAAGLTAHSALSHALAELESRVFAWACGHAPAARRPAAVRTPADHFELYGQRRYYRRADALFHSPSIGLDWRNASQHHASGALVERMTLAGIPPLIADLTTPECVLDHGTRPLHVVKVFVPTPVSYTHLDVYKRQPSTSTSPVARLGTLASSVRMVPPWKSVRVAVME